MSTSDKIRPYRDQQMVSASNLCSHHVDSFIMYL